MSRPLLLSILLLAACNQTPPAPPPEAGLEVEITNPSKDIFVNGDVGFQVALSGDRPDRVQLFKNGKPLLELVPPYTYAWDTRNEPEGTYAMVARAVKGSKTFDSPARKVVIDRVAPTVVAQTPEGENVWNKAPVSVTFSEAILPSSVNPQTLFFGGGKRGGDLLKGFKLSEDGKTLTLIPSEDYLGGSGYYLALGEEITEAAAPYASVTDLAGNPVKSQGWEWYVPEWQRMGGAVLDTDAGRSAVVPSVALDPSGHPVVAWHELEKNRKLDSFHVRRWNGAAWVKLGGSPTVGEQVMVSDPRIALDGAGNPLAVWTENPEVEFLNGKMYVKRWSPEKSLWEPVGGALNAPQGKGAYFPSITADAEGDPVVAFVQYDAKDQLELFVKVWDPAGGEWKMLGGGLPSARLKGSPLRPSVAKDKSGNFYLAWTQNQPYVARLVGGEWELIGESVSPNLDLYSVGASLTLDGQGRPVLAWAERATPATNPAQSKVYVARREGDAWKQLWNTNVGCTAPSLALDRQDQAVLTCRTIGTNSSGVLLYLGGDENGSSIPFKAGLPGGGAWPDFDFAAGGLALDAADTPVVANVSGPEFYSLDLSVMRWNGNAGRQK